MRKVMKFWTGQGLGWMFGWYDDSSDEFILPSGYIMPVENGYVFYMGEWRELVEI